MKRVDLETLSERYAGFYDDGDVDCMERILCDMPEIIAEIRALREVEKASRAYFEGRRKYETEGYAKHDACIDALSSLPEVPPA